MLFGMYWNKASTAGAYAAVLISLIIPISDIIARRVYLAKDIEFPVEPHITGFWTYIIAISALIIISLFSKEKTRYWDLGKTVKDLNKTKEISN